jgi:hypothetical protein
VYFFAFLIQKIHSLTSAQRVILTKSQVSAPSINFALITLGRKKAEINGDLRKIF